jgi:hypothetical protein
VAVLRTYKCGICTRESSCRESISAPLLTVCPYLDCGSPSLKVVPSWTGRPLITGTAHVNGERRFRRPEVVQERDGSETVYTSLKQMARSELDRAIHPTIAKDNVKRAAKRLLPGTKQAAYQEAMESRAA